VSKEKGVVKFFNVQKGYGFITPEAGGNDLFFHISNMEEGSILPKENSKVEFARGAGKKGPEATQVVVTE
jgi:cold shock protein